MTLAGLLVAFALQADTQHVAAASLPRGDDPPRAARLSILDDPPPVLDVRDVALPFFAERKARHGILADALDIVFDIPGTCVDVSRTIDEILAPEIDVDAFSWERRDVCTMCEDFVWIETMQEEVASRSVGDWIVTALETGWKVARTVVEDALYLLASPLRFNKGAILPTLGVVAILGAAAAFDEPLQRWWGRNATEEWHDFFDRFEQPGNDLLVEVSLIGVGAALAIFTEHDWVLEMGLTALEARAFSQPVVNGLKEAVGRSRPNQSDDAFRFHAFSGNSSFPSGHVINVAPTMTVVRRYLNHWLADVVTWTLIALKALQRIDGNNHWLSDTVGSILIGTLIGNALVDRRQDPSLRILPFGGDDGSGGGCLGISITLRR